MNSQVLEQSTRQTRIAVRTTRRQSVLSTFIGWLVTAAAVSKSIKNSEDVQDVIRASSQISPSLAQELNVIAGRD